MYFPCVCALLAMAVSGSVHFKVQHTEYSGILLYLQVYDSVVASDKEKIIQLILYEVRRHVRKHWRRKFCVFLKGFSNTQNALTLTTHPCGEHTPARSNVDWSQLSPSPFLLYSGAAISAAPSSHNQQIIWRALFHTS